MSRPRSSNPNPSNLDYKLPGRGHDSALSNAYTVNNLPYFPGRAQTEATIDFFTSSSGSLSHVFGPGPSQKNFCNTSTTSRDGRRGNEHDQEHEKQPRELGERLASSMASRPDWYEQKRRVSFSESVGSIPSLTAYHLSELLQASPSEGVYDHNRFNSYNNEPAKSGLRKRIKDLLGTGGGSRNPATHEFREGEALKRMHS
jgi:hypothetical protein